MVSGKPKTAASRFGEDEAILLLNELFSRRRAKSRATVVSIGDDAAVLEPRRSEQLVWTVDACVEGVHFDRRWLPLGDVGWRSFQAAASDLAAMGARPLAALSSLIVPPAFRAAELHALGKGQAEAARALRCPIVGGNIARGSELSITSSMLGQTRAPLLRSAARAGQELWLVGDVGLARAGLELLRRGFPNGFFGESRARLSSLRTCVAAWRRPTALIARGRLLGLRASAALDISDGLAGDVQRLARASGVRAVIEAALLKTALRSELLIACSLLDASPVEFALEGGEDYALLATGPHAKRPRWARPIGRVERGRGAYLEPDNGGPPVRLARGFDHLL